MCEAVCHIPYILYHKKIQIMKVGKEILLGPSEKTPQSVIFSFSAEPRSIITRNKQDKPSISGSSGPDKKQSQVTPKMDIPTKSETNGRQSKISPQKTKQCRRNAQQQNNLAPTQNSGKSLKGREWTEKDDQMLRNLVLYEKQYDWKKLASCLGARTSEVMKRWQQYIYPKIKTSSKVGGALKWSFAQDSILIGYEEKNGSEWEQMLQFLPQRTVYSLQGRWRRITKNMSHLDVNNHRFGLEMPNEIRSSNKYQHRKHIIRLIASIAEGKNRLEEQQEGSTNS